MRTLILIPTETEAAPLRAACPDAPVRIAGVGMAATAAATARIIAEEHPDRLILAGIAGASDRSVAVCEVVAVAGELTFEVAYYDIEELNRRAEAGEADVSKISYALLPEIQSRYTLLDSGSALGRGNGPVFVARQGTPPDSIRRVAVPGLHTTANALMSRLYPSITQKEPVLFSEIAPAVARGEYNAGVLIHEGRFVYRKLGLELIADLGELWESRTGLPLPLGAIVARRTLPEELRCEIERLLRTSIEYAFAHREESRTYIKEHARELDDRVIDHHIDFFVNSYSLSLGDEGRRAVRELTGVKV